MNKILQIAWREFVATAMTKGFIIGLVAMPVIMLVAMLAVPLLTNFKTPAVHGEIAVLDRSDAGIDALLAASLSPDAFAERRRKTQARIEAAMPEAIRGLQGGTQAQTSMNAALGGLPRLRVTALAADADGGRASGVVARSMGGSLGSRGAHSR